jgi:hypothetical protein
LRANGLSPSSGNRRSLLFLARSAEGQTRHFDRAPTTSDLSRLTDVRGASLHVSKVPDSDIATYCSSFLHHSKFEKVRVEEIKWLIQSMLERMVAPTRFLWRLLVERARKVQDVHERYRAFTGEDAREARDITLLREWLSKNNKRNPTR